MHKTQYTVHSNIAFKGATESDHYILIEDGPYKGLCVNFGKIEFIGENSDGFGKINFNYDLLYIPEDIKLEDVKEDLEKTLGEVLNTILEDIMLREAETNETGNSDTQQPTE